MSGECDKCGEHCLECICSYRWRSYLSEAKWAVYQENMMRSKYIEKLEKQLKETEKS